MIDIIDGELKISVRQLVEFLCKKGNLDNRFGRVSDRAAMDAGTRIHKKLQKSMGPDYKSEVSLALTIPKEEYYIQLEGRADGIFSDNYDEGDIVFIDEIKGTYKEVKYMSEPVYVHKAQALCYAYIYARREMTMENTSSKIGIRMTYVNLVTEEIKYFKEIFSLEELDEWFEALLNELSKWGDYLIRHRRRRDESIEKLEFPFDYRAGQRKLSVSVYKTIAENRNLYINAPTGVGKTISTVFPAVKAMGKNFTNKLFYLTAKTITRTAAEDTYTILRNNNLIFKTITITAKEKLCLMEMSEGVAGPQCNPVACMYAKGHFDRVNEAVFDLINCNDSVTREIILDYAKKYQVCPFEMCLDVSYWVDGIICDYNYVFDPEVRLKRYFSEGNSGKYTFLVDEAHNLVDRARQMYSAELYKEKFPKIKKLVEPYSKRLAAAVERCNRAMLKLKRQCAEEYLVVDSDADLSLAVAGLEGEINSFLENNRELQDMEALVDIYFDVMHFNRMNELCDNNYVRYCEHTQDGFMYKLFCVNPGKNIGGCISENGSGIFFSATLLPINYYKELLTDNKEEYAIYAASPFDINKRLLMIGTDVTSRYTRRDRNEYNKIYEYITCTTEGKKGNYLVFFPSYKYMEAVYNSFYLENPRVIMQSNNMTEAQKEEFLNYFNNKEDNYIGFCVLGGIFSEGIDLRNDSLIGTIIIGTGLPSISTGGQIIREYFDKKENRGYEYAYVYPGMNKVLQAAGRVIRTEADTGVILLLDDRFLWEQYIRLFPKEWLDYKVVSRETVKELRV